MVLQINSEVKEMFHKVEEAIEELKREKWLLYATMKIEKMKEILLH